MWKSPTTRPRLRLWLKSHQCHWCGCRTTLFSKGPRGWSKLFPHTATIDHVKSKLAGRLPGEMTPQVLACNYCNKSRSELEQSELTGRRVGPRLHLDWLRRFRSGLDGDGI